MGSQYDNFGSLLGQGFSSGNPLSAMFGGIPDTGMNNPYNNRQSGLQLAPLYSSQRPQSGRGTQFHHEENDTLGDYEDEEETYSNVDASGIHVGVRRSRTHHTPFGPARANVGMQMSVGQHGLTMRTQTSSSFGFGGGSTLMLSFGGRPYQQLPCQRGSDLIGNSLSPFGGLFSPFYGVFPYINDNPSAIGFGAHSRTGSHRQEECCRSDGPIIEEIFEENVNECNGLKKDHACIDYKQEEVDSSLGLGLLPDTDFSNENKTSKKDSENENNGILNENAFASDTRGMNKNIGRRKEERTVRRNKNKNHRKTSHLRDIREEKEESRTISASAISVNTISKLNGQQSLHGVEQTVDETLQSEKLIAKSKLRQKFLKKEFRKTPLSLEDDFNSLQFLRSPIAEENGNKNDHLKSIVDERPVCSNTQERRYINKNSFVRCRRDSSESTASVREKISIDDEFTESCDIATDILNTQSFPTKHADYVNSEAVLREAADIISRKDALQDSKVNSKYKVAKKTKIPTYEFQHIPDETLKLSVEITKDTLGKNDNFISTEKLSSTADCPKEHEQRCVTIEEANHKYADEKHVPNNTTKSRCTSIPANGDFHEKNNKMCDSEKDLITLGDSQTTSEVVHKSTKHLPMSKDEKDGDEVREQSKDASFNVSTENKSIQSQIYSDPLNEGKRNLLELTSDMAFNDSMAGSEDNAMLSNDERRKLLIIFCNTQKKHQNSNKPTTIFMPNKERKEEAGNMFQLNHIRDRQQSERSLKLSSACISDESGSVGSLFDEETYHTGDDKLEKNQELYVDLNEFKTVEDKGRQLPKVEIKERVSPVLELFHSELQDSYKPGNFTNKRSVYDSKNKSEQMTNIKFLKTKRNDDSVNVNNFSCPRNELITSQDNMHHLQWEYPGQPHQYTRRLFKMTVEENSKNSYLEEAPTCDEEKENWWSRDKEGSHKENPLHEEDSRQCDYGSYSELMDLSNDIGAEPLQMTQSYDGCYTGSKQISSQNIHANDGAGNSRSGRQNESRKLSFKNLNVYHNYGKHRAEDQYSGEFNHLEQESKNAVHGRYDQNSAGDLHSGRYNEEANKSVHNVQSHRRVNNQHGTGGFRHSREDMRQSNSPYHHSEDNEHTFDHMCPHMLLQAQCEHKNVYKFFHKCCNNYHYACDDCDKQMSLEEYNIRKRDNEDIYQHPDWQYLNEYKDEYGKFQDTKPKVKRKINKNATVKTSPSSSSAKTDQSSPSNIRGPGSRVDFNDLVESVGLIMKDVHPDGNCLFTSICDQLRIRGDFSYTPRDLRHAAVDFLRENPNQEDGTPLLNFLADEERNWEKYLNSMSRDGHWGDHFVIWALAHVLNRRIVIYRGENELHKTIVEPSVAMELTAANKEIDQNTTEETRSKDGTKDFESEQDKSVLQKQTYDLYLGHISESHYVSLRPKNWREELFEELARKQTSCLVGNNPDTKGLDSNGDVFVRRKVSSLSPRDLDFFLNYLRRGQVIFRLPMSSKFAKFKQGTYCTNHFIGDFLFDYKLWANFKTQEESRGIARKNFKNYVLRTPIDTLVTPDCRNVNKKDLILHDDGRKFGKVKLIPVQPNLWKFNLIYRDGVPFLKHIEHQEMDSSPSSWSKIGFKCATWPEEAMEWKSRKRLYDWPSQSTIDKILETGARVVPSKSFSTEDYYTVESNDQKVKKANQNRVRSRIHPFKHARETGDEVYHNSEECLTWEIDFSVSESILCQKDIQQTQKTLYCILEAITQFVFAGKNLITCEHLKTLLYITCENHPNEELWHQPGKCLLYELDLLREFLQRKHFPHYFLRGKNLIANASYEETAWHIERLEVAMSNLLTVLYCVLDYCILKNVFDLGKVFNGLSAVVCSQDSAIPDDYPIPLCITSLSNVIKSMKFTRARNMIDIWHSELIFSFGRQTYSKEEFVNQLLSELPIQEQWLFALYIDCQDESNYLQFVCRGRACVQLKNLFGDNVTPYLTDETCLKYSDIPLPTVMFGESMISFARQLGETLYSHINSTRAYQSAIHHFLKSNTHDLLLSIESDQKNNRDYYTNSKLTDLRVMFEELYDTYRHERHEFMFRDLMANYDELCNFLATERDFEYLSELWTFFGEQHLAREAHLKAESVREKSYTVSTAL